MRNNTIDIVFVGLILVILIGYFMLINLVVKKDIMDQLNLAEDYARNEEWNKVLETSKNIKRLWNKYKYIIMFNFGEFEFFDFDDHINYITGGAESKQLDTTLSNILSAQDLWENFGKTSPEP